MARTHRLQPGTIFADRYRVRRLLGQGAMGAVYLVQTEQGEELALKVLKPDVASDPKALARFEREIMVGDRIASPHVAEVLAAGVDEATGLPWLTMEVLGGVSLSELLSEHELKPQQRGALVDQLLDAVAAAHAAGVIHRDLKPDNIFVVHWPEAPTIKVLDFGIAKLFAPSLIASATEEGLGTPMWTAPEQARAGQAIGPSADVWALGLLVFYLMTGKIYWRHMNEDGSTMVELVMEIMQEPLAAASARAGALGRSRRLPEGFDAWFERCVVRDPSARFAHAGEAREALRPLLGEAPSRSRARRWGALLGVLLVAAAGLAWALLR